MTFMLTFCWSSEEYNVTASTGLDTALYKTETW